MIAAPFAYYRARSVADALELIASNDEAKVLAGGQSLVSMMKLRLVSPSVLIDLNDIDSMRALAREHESIRVGALVTHATIHESALIESLLPALHDAAGVVGDPQVRNCGTLGGAAAHGDPSADYPAVLLALDARLTLVSKEGARSVGTDDFFIGMFETALEHDEILTDISFEVARTSAYQKIEHPASGYPIVGAAARLTIAGGRIVEARLALTGLGAVALRLPDVERALAGIRTGDERAIAKACVDVAAGMDVVGDIHAPADYRIAMADVLTERVIHGAIAREL